MTGQKTFNTAASPTAEAEAALTERGIVFTKQSDNTLLVLGDIDLSGEGLTRLPDLSCVIVTGGFFCGSNKLTSLVGSPKEVSDHGCKKTAARRPLTLWIPDVIA